MSQSDPAFPGQGNLSVLIVDDDRYFIQLLNHQLNGLGVKQVRSAQSGSQALFELGAPPGINLVICDLQMPTMNGVEFLHQLEYQGYTGDVILVSGEDQRVLESVSELVRAYGMSLLGALNKPVERDDLQGLLSAARPGRSTPATETSRSHIAPPAQLEINQLSAHFQPVIDLARLELVGVEALLRPLETGPADAQSISQQFAENGRASILSQHVLEQSLNLLQDCAPATGNWTLTLNLFAAELMSPTLPDMLQRICEQADFALSRLVLDIVDIPQAEQSARILDVSNRLFLQGVRFAIDGPGASYAELERLMQLPFSLFKIDRRFIQGAHQRKHAPTILKAQADLAHNLGLQVVAEGVETQEDLDTVALAGCDLVQGDFISAAMPAQDLEAWTAWFAHKRELSPD